MDAERRLSVGAANRWVLPALVLLSLGLGGWMAWRSLGRAPSGAGPTSGGLGVAVVTPGPNALRGFALEPPKPAPEVDLVDTAGRAWRGDARRGTVWALFFGYTRCPDVCPQTLAAMAGAMAELDRRAQANAAGEGGSAADAITLAMVTVDPDRDTPQVLADYVHGFDARFVGLTGSVADIRRTAGDWGVAFEREMPPAAATAALAAAAGHAPSSGAHDDSGAHDEGGADEDGGAHDDIGLSDLAEGGGADTIVHSGMVFLIDRRGRLRSAFVGAINPADIAHDLALLSAEPAP